MTDVERAARARLAREEAAASRRPAYSLGRAAREFWRHPSPWIVTATLAGAAAARLRVGDWSLSDLWVPVVLLATFPVVEWLIHVCILHWRPRQVGPVRVDSLLARKHRAHHADPRDVPLVFIPWPVFLWLLPALLAVTLLAFPSTALGLTWLVGVTALGIVYEWMHFLIHSDYKPRTRVYRAIWRDHRLHHYKNENYWFSVTTSGTSDRLFGTWPDPTTVPTSPTAKNLHGDASG